MRRDYYHNALIIDFQDLRKHLIKLSGSLIDLAMLFHQ